MTTIPDPKTVREIARDAMRQAVRSGRDAVVDLVVAEHWPEAVNPEFLRHRDVVAAEYDRLAATPFWPDELPHDERGTCGVQIPADSAQRLNASPDTRCARPDGHAAHDGGNGVLWVDRERAAQGESDGDVQAVAALLDVLARTDQRNRPKVLHGPIADLRERFADRIAALEARDSKAGDEQ